MGVVKHGIEHAGPQAAALEPVGIVRLVGEEPLEDQLRIDLGGKGRGRVAPGERVLIDARIAAVAVAGAAEGFDAQLKRGKAGLVAELLSGNLVGGNARTKVCAGRLAGLSTCEECRGGAGVV